MLARLLSMVPLRTASIICMMAADGFGVFNQSDGVDFGVDASLYALDHAGVEIAKVFLLERGGTTAVSVIWMWVQRRRFGCRGVGIYREIRVFLLNL